MSHGEVVIVSPYLDAQTHSVIITIGKEITETDIAKKLQRQNVVCLDVIVNHIQEVTQSVDVAGKGFGMVVNTDGFIVAHREKEYNGKNLAELYGQDLLDSIVSAKNGRITATIN